MNGKTYLLCVLAAALAAMAASCGMEETSEEGDINLDVLIAYAGEDQYVEQGSEVQMRARSLAQDATAQWEILFKPAGSGVTLADPNVAQFTFTPDVMGSWEFKLTVSRASSTSATDTVKVSTIFHAPPYDDGAMAFLYNEQVPASSRTPWTRDAQQCLAAPDLGASAPLVQQELRSISAGKFFSTRMEFSQYEFAPNSITLAFTPGTASGFGVTFAGRDDTSWTEAVACLNETECGGRWMRLAVMQGNTPVIKGSAMLGAEWTPQGDLVLELGVGQDGKGTTASLKDGSTTVAQMATDDMLFGWGPVGLIMYRPRGDTAFCAFELKAHIKPATAE